MKVGEFVHRRRSAVLILIFLLVICALAEEGVLVVILTDIGEHPFPGARISATGVAGSPQAADQNGKVRLKLAPGTKPNSWVKLLIANPPNGIDLAFVSPPDGRVRVPSFDNEQDNYDPVVIVKRGEKAMLESGAGMLAIHAAVTTSAAAQRKKPTNPSSQDYRRHPSTVAFNSPHLQTVSWRESIAARDHDNPLPADEAIQQAALAAAAAAIRFIRPGREGFDSRLGRRRAAVGRAHAHRFHRSWAALTRSPSFAPPTRTSNSAPESGACGTAASRQSCCSFNMRDQRRFAEIIGADTEWLSKTMIGPCEASAKAALQRMLDNSGHLSTLWRSRFRNLGNEHSFQHVQVEQLGLEMIQARRQASALGLQSEQAVAFLAAPAIRRLVSATPAFREGCLQGIASFTRQNGRAPGEREKLLILKNRIIQSWDEQPKISPEATADFVSLVDLFFDGSGTVSGRHYDLDDFGIGMTSTRTVDEAKSSGPTPWSAACSSDVFDPTAEKQLVDLMNQERTKQGIPPLQVDPRLTQAARKHTALMVQNHSKTHQIGSEPQMPARLSNENLPSDQKAENISVAPTVAANHETMMHSPDHRANIMNPDYNVVGVGAVQCGALWVTQDFAHRLPEYSESQADSALAAGDQPIRARAWYASTHAQAPGTVAKHGLRDGEEWRREPGGAWPTARSQRRRGMEDGQSGRTSTAGRGTAFAIDAGRIFAGSLSRTQRGPFWRDLLGGTGHLLINPLRRSF